MRRLGKVFDEDLISLRRVLVTPKWPFLMFRNSLSAIASQLGAMRVGISVLEKDSLAQSGPILPTSSLIESYGSKCAVLARAMECVGKWREGT